MCIEAVVSVITKDYDMNGRTNNMDVSIIAVLIELKVETYRNYSNS